jgi:hypothetical protein
MLIRFVPLSRFGHDIAIEMQEGEVALAHDIFIHGTGLTLRDVYGGDVPMIGTSVSLKDNKDTCGTVGFYITVTIGGKEHLCGVTCHHVLAPGRSYLIQHRSEKARTQLTNCMLTDEEQPVENSDTVIVTPSVQDYKVYNKQQHQTTLSTDEDEPALPLAPSPRHIGSGMFTSGMTRTVAANGNPPCFDYRLD